MDYTKIYQKGDKVEFVETFITNEPRVQTSNWVYEVPKGTIGEIVNVREDSVLVSLEGLLPNNEKKRIRFYGPSNEIYKESPIDALKKLE